MGLNSIIAQFKGKKVIVIGDIILDHYIWGNVNRISPEAPVPIIEATRESQTLGGAANVANTIHCLKGKPLLVGVVGNDDHGKELNKKCKEIGLDTSGIFIDNSRPTTTKTRLVVESLHQQIARVDREKRHPIPGELQDRVFDFVKLVSSEFDAILFEDYDKGMLDGGLIKRITQSFSNKIITVDPKFDHFLEYEGVTLFKPNKKEVELAMGVKFNTQNVLPVCHKLMKKLRCKSVLLTLGKDGMILFEEGRDYRIPTHAREVYDETAAGDAAIAGVTMALAAGGSLRQSAYIANLAAGIEVGKFGAIPVTYDELLQAAKTTNKPR